MYHQQNKSEEEQNRFDNSTEYFYQESEENFEELQHHLSERHADSDVSFHD
jgi:hypothetical protein